MASRFGATIPAGVWGIVFFLAVAALRAADGGAVSLDLVRDGVPAATIIVAKQPTRSAQFSAAELQYHVRKITGATLPISDDGQAIAGNRVLVGESEATVALGLKNDDFAPQEYLIRFRPGTLVLMGRDRPDLNKFDYADAGTFPDLFEECGTCYAVYDFLERHCGVRWYLPTELGLCHPTTKTLQASGTEVRRSPAMKYRRVYNVPYPLDLCGDTVPSPKPPPALPAREQALFAMRHRLGGTPFTVNHSLYGYYDRFWKEGDTKPGPAFEQFHPEFFAQGYKGKPPQMCYTNPGLVQQVIQDARDYFDGKGAKAGAQVAGDFFAIVPMDNPEFCKCPNCTAALGEKKTSMRGKGMFSYDRDSDYFFAFINKVAREIKKSHPQKRLATLAYWSYAYPPTKEKLEPNVWITLCLFPRHTFSSVNQENDAAILNAWVGESKERTKLLWLYYCYPTFPAVAQQWRCFPGFFAHSIAGKIQEYRQAGIYGIFCEPAYLAHGQRSPLMDQLEFYVTWKLADDPSLDGNALIDEFFDRYYGSAAGPMKAFYELVEKTYADPANYPPNYTDHQTEAIAWNSLGTEPRMAQLGRLMDQARAAAKTDIEKQRVALFDKGIWKYMQAGRNAYLSAHPNASR
jgi:hypothetical protein